MYELGDVVPEREVPAGTNLLVAGPPLTGKRRLALRLLAAGHAAGEGVLVVTTKDTADRVVEEYGDLMGDLEGAPFGVVDCVSRKQGGGDVLEDDRVRYASSPVDVTGIGIELSELLEEFHGERDVRRSRVLLYSLSTLLMYADLDTVFRFLHVFTGRVESAGALGVYVIDATAHDDRTVNTLNQLFDGVVRVEEGEDGEPWTRLQGL
jgi:KaiC/GvpD/RAD55 family RecA-like ATPase